MKKHLHLKICIFLFLLSPNFLFAQTYCKARGNDCGFNFIAKVSLNTIENSSPCTNYGDYTQTHATVLDKDYTLTVTWGGNPQTANYILSCYIDFNKDGVFTEIDEEFPLTLAGLGVSTATISVPAGSLSGKTRMRIRMVQNAKPVPCGDQSRGEVEDYSVVIPGTTNSAPIARNDKFPAFSGFPNEFPVLFNDDDNEGNLDSSKVAVKLPPEHGDVSVSPNGRIIYTPFPNYFGKDSLQYEVCDKGSPSLCGNAFVFIDVVPADSNLNANPDFFNLTKSQGTDTLNVLKNDFFLSGFIDSANIQILTNTTLGSLQLDTNTFNYIYTYQATNNSIDSFQYKICGEDGFGGCDSTWAYIFISDSVITGLQNQGHLQSIANLPSIGSGELRIDLTGTYQLTVIDRIGNRLATFNNLQGTSTPSIQHLDNGMYLLLINYKNRVYVNKYFKY